MLGRTSRTCCAVVFLLVTDFEAQTDIDDLCEQICIRAFQPRKDHERAFPDTAFALVRRRSRSSRSSNGGLGVSKVRQSKR